MQISVAEAKGQLTELVRRAEAGDEAMFTRHGQAAVKLAPVRRRRAVISRARTAAACKRTADASAARREDFLYDGDGSPK